MINVRRFGILRASSILVNTVAKTMSTGGRLQQSKLEGKVAIVTASTEGIGFAIARSLGENGAKVIVSSRKEERVMNAVKLLKDEGLEVRGTVCHVGKAEDRKKLVDLAVSEYGGLDILVSNAGINPSFGPILDTPESSWDKIFDTNVKAPFLLTKECMPHLEKKGGSIVIVASIAGYQPLPGLGAYSVSKTALLGLTRTLASELGPRNVRVNCIAPGIIKTAFSKADGKNVIKLCGKLEFLSFHKLWSNDSIKELVLQQVPLGRLGESSDCGGLAVFLCSDDAKYITGETIPVTGGMVSRL